jgi:hypothetical protein
MELREVLGRRATDEQRLLELIEEVPGDSIYYHTHSYYLRHPFTRGLFPNDFATWVTLYVQDRLLGECLGVVDPFEFEDVNRLRGEIVSIIGDHLSRIGSSPRCIPTEPFEFVRSHIIESELGLEVRTLLEFRNALAQVEVGAIYNHVCEARMRKGRLPGDFACWLAADEGLSMPELAAQVVKVGRLGLSLEGIREHIVRLCDQALAS